MNLRKTNSPKRISIISRSITKDIFKKRGFKEHKVITNWKDIVGDEISIYTIPESLTHNKLLTIKCESSHALEFQYHIPKIIERINEKYIAIKFNPEKPGKYFAGSKDSLSGRQLLMALSNNKPSGYPTFFFFVPQDAKLFQLPGYQDVNQFGATMNNIEKYQAQLITKD